MAALASARLPRRAEGRHELPPASGSTTDENHEPEDAHAIVCGTAFRCRSQGAILKYSGALQNMMQ